MDFPEHLCKELIDGWVTRQQLLKVLDLDTGIRYAVTRQARRMNPPHVAERREKGRPFQVAYHLRPAEPGEQPGALIEVGPVP